MAEDKRLTSEERQQLVAYLDNEVPDEVAAILESKIAGSASARREVEELRQAWDLLDFLPMPEAPTDFSHRTVEILTQQSQQRGELGKKVVDRGWQVVYSVAGVVAIVLCFVGGFAGARLFPDPDKQIVRELPVLERFDQYNAVRNMTFLRGLKEVVKWDESEEPLTAFEGAKSK